MKLTKTPDRAPIEIKDSYYSYLKYMGYPIKSDYEMGYHFNGYTDEELYIYKELKELELTSDTIKALIKSYNLKISKLDPYENPNIDYSKRSKIRNDIKNHYIITNILYDMKSNSFIEKYTLYKKIDMYEKIIFIGIDGTPNDDLLIPKNVDKIINTGVFDKSIHKKPIFPVLNSSKIEMPITSESVEELNKAINERLMLSGNNSPTPDFVSILHKKIR